MGAETGIQWTHATFNPWWGCEKVSPACANCYAERDSSKYGHRKLWGRISERRFFGEKHWMEPLKWNAKAAVAGKPFRVFCASMGDVFEDRRDLDGPRAALFDLVERTPALTWILLTKRPGKMTTLAPSHWSSAWPRHVWAMTTAENQEQADGRIPDLLKVPAAVHGVSMEPLLGRVDLGRYDDLLPKMDWVIVGGESGDKARPTHPQWIRDIRDQCQSRGIAFFFKQWGEWAPLNGEEWLRRGYPDVEPGGAFPMRRLGKQLAGRKLFGREWNEFPGEKSAPKAA